MYSKNNEVSIILQLKRVRSNPIKLRARYQKVNGAFITVAGPMAQIVEQSLCWLAMLRVIGFGGSQMVAAFLDSGPRYAFSA